MQQSLLLDDSDREPFAEAEPFTGLLEGLYQRGWSIQRNFLPPSLIARLRDEAQAQWRDGVFQAAAIGRGDEREVRPEIRGDQIHWLDTANAAPAQHDYLTTMERLRTHANRTLLLGLERFEVHAARYPEGHGYRRHLDRFRGSEERLLTCVLYLNEDWRAEEGGALRLYTGEGEVEVLPEAGTLAAFITEGMWHEVLPATRPRLAMTGWYRRDGAFPL